MSTQQIVIISIIALVLTNQVRGYMIDDSSEVDKRLKLPVMSRLRQNSSPVKRLKIPIMSKIKRPTEQDFYPDEFYV